MTTTSERYLQKQIERRDKLIEILLGSLNAAVDESEFRASVACGFAWDFVNARKMREMEGVDTLAMMELWWDEAVAAMEASNQEPK